MVLYEITTFRVEPILTWHSAMIEGFTVTSDDDGSVERFESLEEAVLYADNGEFSEEGQRVIDCCAEIWNRRFENYLDTL